MEQPSLEELKATEWYQQRPQTIKDAIDKMPPTYLYRFKDSGKQCYIIGYTEPESPDDQVTLIVQKTGEGGPMAEIGLGVFDTNQVFGVHFDRLEVIDSQ